MANNIVIWSHKSGQWAKGGSKEQRPLERDERENQYWGTSCFWYNIV